MQSLTIVPPNSAQPLHLAGKITIPLDLASLPTQGALQEMQTAYLEKPVLLDMRWQQQQGVLTVSEKATIARWRCCRGKSRRSGSASSRASGVGRTAGSR